MRFEEINDLIDEELEKWRCSPADQSEEVLDEVDEELEKYGLQIVEWSEVASDILWKIEPIK